MGSPLDGTAALVTGASSGIGEATAHALASRGGEGGAGRPTPLTGPRLLVHLI